MKLSVIFAGDPWASEVLAQNLQSERGIPSLNTPHPLDDCRVALDDVSCASSLTIR